MQALGIIACEGRCFVGAGVTLIMIKQDLVNMAEESGRQRDCRCAGSHILR